MSTKEPGDFPEVTPEWVEPPALSRIEIPYQKLDTSKIASACGWHAEASFADTVAKLVGWWRENWDGLPASIRNWKATGWHG